MLPASRLTWMFPAIDRNLQVAWPPSYPAAAQQGSDAQLSAAAAQGDEKLLRQILGQKADPNALDAQGQTALFHAAMHGHIEAVRILLEFGASVYPRDAAGHTPLLCAMRCGHWDVADMLLRAESHGIASGDHAMPSIQWSARAGNADLIRFLEQCEARLDGANIDSCLLEAVNQGNAGAVRALLQGGADPDARTGDGVSMLMVAADRGDTAVMTSLLLEQADIDAVDDSGKTALMYAVESGSADTVRELLRSDPQVDARSHHGDTALLLAAEIGNADMVALLLRAEADIDATNHDGHCAMLLAAADQHLEVIDHLKAKGADIDAHLLGAVQKGSLAMVQTLISAGAKVDATTPGGKTAMTLAVERADPYIIECLAWARTTASAVAGAGSLLAAQEVLAAAQAAEAAGGDSAAMPSVLEPAGHDSMSGLGAIGIAQPYLAGSEYPQAGLVGVHAAAGPLQASAEIF